MATPRSGWHDRPGRALTAQRLTRRQANLIRPVGYAGGNVVERRFNVLKQWRAWPPRYDKHALTYSGGIVLAAILTWTH